MSSTGFNWTEEHPRFLSDLTGDRRADILGFGRDGVWVARNSGDGTFATPQRVLRDYATETGWRVAKHPRVLADLTGDGRPDLVGFGYESVWTALNHGDGTFQPARPVLKNFCEDAGGWRVADHLRFLADITGDGRADIVGFGNDGVWTALGNGDGTFQDPRLVLRDLAPNANGWYASRHPRFLADVTGDGRADIVGFGDDDVYVLRANGDGTFRAPVWAVGGLGYNQGWRTAQHPRFLADITGDGRADIVAFGNDGMWTARSNGVGGFTNLRLAIQGFTDWLDEDHLRFMVDITGDRRADMVGFNQQGMWTARSNGDGTFIYPGFAGNFGRIDSGWRARRHPRLGADLTGDGNADVVGFGDDGVWTSMGLGNGSFYPAKLTLKDFGAHTGATEVRHVFVLMLENRSFDHMLGFSGIAGTDAATGARTAIEGVTGTESNDFHDVTYHPIPGAPNSMRHDPGHSFDAVLVQLAGYGATYPPGGPYPPIDNSGFAASYGLGVDRDPADVMRCCSEAQLPALHELAREFVLCDHWYASHPGHTWPNRLFVHAASSGGMDMEPDKSDIVRWTALPGDGLQLANGTIFDRLRQAGLAYRLYHDAELLPPMVSTLKGVSVLSINDLDDLASDLADPAFRDVRYVHIEPRYDPPHEYANGNSQHPLGDVRKGDQLIKRIYETIRNSPVWEHSLLIVTWDEHGGFYDHVAPPATVPPADAPAAGVVNKHRFAFDRLGPRVPALIISPLIPKNLIDHRVYDHASVPATIEHLLELDPLTERDRHANSLHPLIQLTQARTDTPARLQATASVTAPRTVTTSPAQASAPTRSIDENQIAAFVYAAYAQDIELSHPSQHPTIRARVAAIRTHQQALDYMRDVAARACTARNAQAARTPDRTAS